MDLIAMTNYGLAAEDALELVRLQDDVAVQSTTRCKVQGESDIAPKRSGFYQRMQVSRLLSTYRLPSENQEISEAIFEGQRNDAGFGCRDADGLPHPNTP